jgi:dipeptidyl aminopeptidase/acylaminoacyl peptidase
MRSILILLLFQVIHLHAQYPNKSSLTLESIMAGNDFIGHSPTSPFWSVQQDSVYFYWQKPEDIRSELYAYVLKDQKNVKVPLEIKPLIYSRPDASQQLFDGKFVMDHQGGIALFDKQFKFLRYLIQFDSRISQIAIQPNKKGFYFLMDQVYYHYDYINGSIKSLYKLYKGKKDEEKKDKSSWLKKEELKLFDHLQEAADKKLVLDSLRKIEQSGRTTKPEYYLEEKNGNPALLSSNGKAAFIILSQREPSTATEVPDFIAADGYVKMLNGRPKVGVNQNSQELLMLLPDQDTSIMIDFSMVHGIKDKPDYKKEYHKDSLPYELQYKQAKPIFISGLIGSADSTYAIADVFSRDNKDRWILKILIPSGKVEVIDHQRDQAWIGGPGVRSFGGAGIGFLKDNNTLYFQSESDGYSHLYTYDIAKQRKTQITSGNFEIQKVQLSKDGRQFLIHANKEHPGVFNLYKVNTNGSGWTAITAETEGRYDAVWSPDESHIVAIYSLANQPAELFIRKSDDKSAWKQITYSISSEFQKYAWRKPEFRTFKASDGAEVHARVYKPHGGPGNKAAVIFVHGAGYLQNAHKHWSTYYREYMFHQFLSDNGYTVLDIDYRGSAGYGRDWRTGIYRHMGGKDLSDHVDAIPFLVSEYGVDPEKIGIYGGSYGGFITLMALFQHPGTFACGAALRSVTDWAHYNHGYTANILNTPEEDSIAFVKSSPIYYAENLADPLLILHGMVDVNVQFQDVVRLSQRLIELEKNNWEMAVFPIEDHGFVRTSSWIDEYKRIYLLFDKHLNK